MEKRQGSNTTTIKCANCSSFFKKFDVMIREIPVAQYHHDNPEDFKDESRKIPSHIKDLQKTLRRRRAKQKQQQRTMKVSHVLSTLYNLEYMKQLNFTFLDIPDDDDLYEDDDDVDSVQLCEPCADILTQLFMIFNEFSQLRSVDSYLSKKIVRLDSLVEQIHEFFPDNFQNHFSMSPIRVTKNCVYNNNNNSSSNKSRCKKRKSNHVLVVNGNDFYDNLNANDDDDKLYSGLEENDYDDPFAILTADSEESTTDPLELDNYDPLTDEKPLTQKVLSATVMTDGDLEKPLILSHCKIISANLETDKYGPENMEVDIIQEKEEEREMKTAEQTGSTIEKESNQQLTDINLLIPPSLSIPSTTDVVVPKDNTVNDSSDDGHGGNELSLQVLQTSKLEVVSEKDDDKNDDSHTKSMPNNINNKIPEDSSTEIQNVDGFHFVQPYPPSISKPKTRQQQQQSIKSCDSEPSVVTTKNLSTQNQNGIDSQLEIRKTLSTTTATNFSTMSDNQTSPNNNNNNDTFPIIPWVKLCKLKAEKVPAVGRTVLSIDTDRVSIEVKGDKIEKEDLKSVDDLVSQDCDNSPNELNGLLKEDSQELENANQMKHADSNGTNQCDNDSNKLKVVVKGLTSQSKSSLVCSVCQKSLLNVGDLHMHLLSHVSPKSRKCPICDFFSSRWSALASHMAIHINYNPICTVCGQSNLDKPHSLCQKSLLGVTGGSLKTKKKQRLYTCSRPSCCKEFSSKKSLIKHLLTHSAKFPCQFCNKTLLSQFGWKMHLKQHLKHMTDDTGSNIEVNLDPDLDDTDTQGQSGYPSVELIEENPITNGRDSLAKTMLAVHKEMINVKRPKLFQKDWDKTIRNDDDGSRMTAVPGTEEFSKETDSNFFARIMQNGCTISGNNPFLEELLSQPEDHTRRKILRRFTDEKRQTTWCSSTR